MKRHLEGKKGEVSILLAGGLEKRPGWINIDLYSETADIKLDLQTEFAGFYKRNSVDNIEACNIFEHIEHWNEVMLECARILKPRGKLLIQVPHYSSVYMWTHYDHKRGFSIFSFDMFCKKKSEFVFEKENDVMLNNKRVFNKIRRELMFPKGLWVWGYAFEWFFNLHPKIQLFWELWLSGIFKASGVLVVLEK